MGRKLIEMIRKNLRSDDAEKVTIMKKELDELYDNFRKESQKLTKFMREQKWEQHIMEKTHDLFFNVQKAREKIKELENTEV